jgi:hypothetical protein
LLKAARVMSMISTPSDRANWRTWDRLAESC